MLHRVCDVSYDENMWGPIRSRKCRSTNCLINYMTIHKCGRYLLKRQVENLISIFSKFPNEITIYSNLAIVINICSNFKSKQIFTCSALTRKMLEKDVNLVIRNGNIVWKQGPYCWYFHLNLKYLGWPYRPYIKTASNGDSCEKFLGENDFEAALPSFCCYGYGANASQAVPTFATDQTDITNALLLL